MYTERNSEVTQNEQRSCRHRNTPFINLLNITKHSNANVTNVLRVHYSRAGQLPPPQVFFACSLLRFSMAFTFQAWVPLKEFKRC
eukprot:1155916-Pelagomonas_calceolata.AAC.7